MLESPTWRANPDWGAKLGYDERALADANRRGIGLLLEVRASLETPRTPVVISGNLGPRGDGYRADRQMSVAEARDYHAAQVRTFAQSDADMIAAFTMNYVEEAIGIVLAAKEAAMPVAIAFTVETDGRLPCGETLAAAIEQTDAATNTAPVYYMINCAHPTHFEDVVSAAGAWRERVRGLRANASKRSHAELDESTDLDSGDPAELGDEYARLRQRLPRLSIVGGCCGTGPDHIRAIARRVRGLKPKRRQPENGQYLSGPQKAVLLDASKALIMVGERLNVRGSQKVRDAVEREGGIDQDALEEVVDEQIDGLGLNVIDVCMDSNLVDTTETLKQVIRAQTTDFGGAMSLDSFSVDTLKEAIKT